MAKHVDAPVGTNSGQHLLCFIESVCQRLFAKNYLLSLGCSHGYWHVSVARRADVDYVDILAMNYLLPVGCVLFPTISCGCLFDHSLVATANNLHNWFVWSIEDFAHLSPGIAVSSAHELIADHCDIEFLFHSLRKLLSIACSVKMSLDQ